MRPLLALLLPWLLLGVLEVPLVGELVGLGLPLIALAAAGAGLLAARSRRRLPAIALASFALAAITGTILPWTPQAQPAPSSGVVIAAANINARNDGLEAATRLAAARPDVLVTQETPRQAIAVLSEAYEHRVSAAPGELGGAIVWSVFPLAALPPLPDTGQVRIAVVEVDAPTPFTLVGAHLPRPWWRSRGLLDGPRERYYQANLLAQQRIADAVADGVAGLPGPVVLAGDLNLTDRGWGYRRLTGPLRDVLRAEWTSPTSTKLAFLPLRLRIDHILTTRDFCGIPQPRIELPGSDHVAIRAFVGPCRT